MNSERYGFNNENVQVNPQGSSSKNSNFNNESNVPMRGEKENNFYPNSVNSSKFHPNSNELNSRQSSLSSHQDNFANRNSSNPKNFNKDSSHFNEAPKLERNSSQNSVNSNSKRGIMITSPVAAHDQSRRSSQSPKRIFGLANKSKDMSGT